MKRTAKPPRLSIHGLKILKALDASSLSLSGADISRLGHIQSGTLYPLLARLEASQIVSSEWETTDPKILCRPRARLYRLTKSGREFARSALRELGL